MTPATRTDPNRCSGGAPGALRPAVPNKAIAEAVSGWIRVGSTAGAIACRGAAIRTAHQAAVVPQAMTTSAVTRPAAEGRLAEIRKRLTENCYELMSRVRQTGSGKASGAYIIA